MSHAPPVLRVALALSTGVAWIQAGAPIALAPIAAVVWFLAPIHTSGRLGSRLIWIALAFLGIFGAQATRPSAPCEILTDGSSGLLSGRYLASPRHGSAPFVRDGRCGVVTVVYVDTLVRAGEPVTVSGTWRVGPGGRPWFLARSLESRAATRDLVEARWVPVRWRDGIARRIERLFGEHASLVSALVLARSEGLDSELRDAYARVGIAHMLAISGYHVGIVGGLAIGVLRACGWGVRRSAIGAAVAATSYVAFIGFPDAALRAALMVVLVALSRARARPPARWGSFGAALLIMVTLEPARLASPGFQLSFAGVAGLTAWCGPLCRWIQAWCRRLGARRCPAEVVMPVASGLAATVATLPVVAWHFERIALVGIPATILATPLVALALVGAILSLVLDFVFPAAATFIADGVRVPLILLDVGATRAASWPWASIWTTRASVVAGLIGVAIALGVARHPRIHGTARRRLTLLGLTSAILAWPVLLGWQGRGTAEILMIDVGQGDALALRSPEGRWLLIDTGPPWEGDPHGHPVVRALAARGVRRVDAVLLTHAHLDHIGGAEAVLGAFDVGVVYDPGLPAPSVEYLAVLRAAERGGVPWRPVRSGDRFSIGGLDLEVLHPPEEGGVTADANETSLVVRVTYGNFDALFTGDAYTPTERLVAERIAGDFEVLKVGHHGSDTSTDSVLVATIRPEVALVSVGRRNLYGHPSRDVLVRLERFGAGVWRTDLRGTVSVSARRDGTYNVSAGR